MTTVRTLHNEAMALSQKALVHREHGDQRAAQDLARQALTFEHRAAEMVPYGEASEPTRSILYRSAASLAYQCEDYILAERLVYQGLSGFPPARVKQELHALGEQIRFSQRLADKNIILDETELRMGLRGGLVAFGKIIYSQFTQRVDALFSIMDRTIQRKALRPYQGSGRMSGNAKPYVHVLDSLLPGSFIVNLQLAYPDQGQQDSFFYTPEAVIHDTINGLRLFQDDNESALRDLIVDEQYYTQFVTMAREVAPDGDFIESVDLTSNTDQILLTRTRRELRDSRPPRLTKKTLDESQRITLMGELDYADARKKKKKDRIAMTTDEGIEYTIRITEGQGDLVRAYFERRVAVTGYRRTSPKDTIDLIDITAAEI